MNAHAYKYQKYWYKFNTHTHQITAPKWPAKNNYLAYLFYKKQYLSSQCGGAWTRVANPGQTNCGIFIEDNRLIKCTTSADEVEEANDFQLRYGHLRVFPEVYGTYRGLEILNKYPDFVAFDVGDNKYFIEMQKLDYDVTVFLFEVLAERLLSDHSNRDIILKVYHEMMPRTELHPDYQVRLKIRDYKYLADPDGRIANVIEQARVHGKSFTTEDGEYVNLRNISDFDVWANKFAQGKRQSVDFLTNFFQLLSDRNFNVEEYYDFISRLEVEIQMYWNMLREQIYMIQVILSRIGKTYRDLKFDNFGIELRDTNDEHLGRIWSHQYNGKYMYVYMLDIAGLGEYDDVHRERIVKYGNEFDSWSKYGQMKGNMVGYPLIRKPSDFSNLLPDNIIQLLSSRINISVQSDPPIEQATGVSI